MSRPASRFRADVEGLRAVAVLGVLVWHAGIPWVPGGYVGVDVFFVISGFLMTGLLVREGADTGRVLLGRFYARRARRLLPAVLATSVGTAILTLTLLPPARWAEIGGDLVAGATYVLNWRLAAESVDYLARDQAPSPLQHFWSLAVEEQFYLVWPVLIIAVLALAGRTRLRFLPMVWVLTLAVGGGSLLASWQLSAASPSAYVTTHTRVWELAVGAVVALLAHHRVRPPRVLAAPVGWVGLAAVVLAMVSYDQATVFPGLAALLPTLGTAAVLVAGPSAGGAGPVALLGLRPMMVVGALSYSLYLWHWPFVVVALQRFGTGQDLSTAVGVGAVALSVLPAWLSFRVVEEPVRRRGRRATGPHADRRGLLLGLNAALTGVLTGLVVMLSTAPSVAGTEPTWRVPTVVQQARDSYGAMVLGSDPRSSPAGAPADDPGPLRPPVTALAADLPARQPDGCSTGLRSDRVGRCSFGDRDGAVRVAVVGDSHAGQWTPALDLLGERHGWAVGSFTKSSCPLTPGLTFDRSGADGPYPSCRTWQANVLEELVRRSPDLVLISNAGYFADGRVIAQAQARAVDALREAGIAVSWVQDTPRPDVVMPACLQQHPNEQTACAFSREQGMSRAGTGTKELLELRPELPVIDLSDAICPRQECAPVIGGVGVYRDSNHVSATYVTSLAPRLEEELLALLDQD